MASPGMITVTVIVDPYLFISNVNVTSEYAPDVQTLVALVTRVFYISQAISSLK